jgi:hypothetical protein
MQWKRSILAAMAFGVYAAGQQPPKTVPPPAPPQAIRPTDENSSQKSLADLAREAVAKKNAQAQAQPKTAIVVTNDNLDAQKGPFSSLALKGQDNTDLILRTMLAFSRSHNYKDTQDAIHQWYDRYDSMLSSAIEESRSLQERQQDSYESSSYATYQSMRPQDYQLYQQVQQDKQRSAYDDQKRQRDVQLISSRVIYALQKIRNGLYSANLRFDWFKVRGYNDSY